MLLRGPLLALVVLAACAGPPRTWAEVRAIGTEEVLLAYLEAHPVGPDSDEAREMLDDLRWRRAYARDTPEAYETYLEQQPWGEHSEEAVRRMDDLLWEEAVRTDEEAAYTDYMKRLGSGGSRHAEAGLRGEQEAWERAESERSEDAFFRYLEWFPDGPHRQAVLDLWDELRWREVRQDGSAEAYRRFLEVYPDSLHALDAERAQRGHLDWPESGYERLRGYAKFLLRTPVGSDDDVARATAVTRMFSTLGDLAPLAEHYSLIRYLYHDDASYRANGALELAQQAESAADAAPFLVAQLIDDTELFWRDNVGVPEIWRRRGSTSPGELAAAALLEIGEPSIGPLASALEGDDWEPEDRIRAAELLGRLPPLSESVMSRLKVVLDVHEPRAVRLAVLDSFGPNVAPTVGQMLPALVVDRDVRVARAAALLLEDWDMPPDDPQLLSEWRRLTGRPAE